MQEKKYDTKWIKLTYNLVGNLILFVDVHVLGGLPVDDFLGLEPEGDLAGGASLVGVRSVDDVAKVKKG